MISDTQSIYQAALALPDAERLKLAERLMESLPPSEDELGECEFVAELDRRFAEIEKDPTSGIPWTEIKRGQ
jgi:putative addiction module component (TIGR02574 family)